MAKQTRLHKTFSALRTGKAVSRDVLANALGLSGSMTQTHVRWLQDRGINVEVGREGRTDKTYRLIDIDKLKTICDNGGRMVGAVRVTTAVTKAAGSATKTLSAKQAGKQTKRVSKPIAERLKQNHLDDAPGVFDDRPASERKGKVSVLDKDLDIAHVTEREFNDIKSMLGIDL